VVDVACGVGYGAHILAQAGKIVTAIDCDEESIEFAKAHYADPRINFRVANANDLGRLPPQDAAVCFETIEHLECPLSLLTSLRCAPMLLASVPNEDVFPWRAYRFHFRHYTDAQFTKLLRCAGFEIAGWYGQHSTISDVERNVRGRTLVVKAVRESKISEVPVEPPTKSSDVPAKVAILGLGPSLNAFVGIAKRLGAVSKLCDEVWGINAVGDVIRCDRVFHMDDVRIQEIRAVADPTGNIAAMLTWLRKHPGPVYTSRKHDGYPGLIEFPLADVLNSSGGERYFNNTAAYAVAYAIHIGVKEIQLFGCDYTYPDAHSAEAGRGCVEFWLGIARSRGIRVSIPKTSTLLDAYVEPARRLYGYDTVEVQISGNIGAETVTLVPRDDLPTAEEIEERYDHSIAPSSKVGE
jgi:SAM-dependent methyltransferase